MSNSTLDAGYRIAPAIGRCRRAKAQSACRSRTGETVALARDGSLGGSHHRLGGGAVSQGHAVGHAGLGIGTDGNGVAGGRLSGITEHHGVVATRFRPISHYIGSGASDGILKTYHIGTSSSR